MSTKGSIKTKRWCYLGAVTANDLNGGKDKKNGEGRKKGNGIKYKSNMAFQVGT